MDTLIRYGSKTEKESDVSNAFFLTRWNNRVAMIKQRKMTGRTGGRRPGVWFLRRLDIYNMLNIYLM